MVCWVCKGHDTAAVEMVSPTLETLSWAPHELAPTGIACAFPKLTALTYNCCGTDFNSIFQELPVLQSLRFESYIRPVS